MTTDNQDFKTIYLNHAGTSWPKPPAVVQAVGEAMAASPGEWGRRFYEAHAAIAEFFGAQDPEQILLTPGCTSSLAVAISDTLIAPGKRVLTSQWEHHALHRPLLKLAGIGVGIEYIPPVTSETTGENIDLVDLDWLERELAKNDVALVAITAACNVTGELLPYHEVTEIAHRYGSMVMIDAAQVVGWLKLDLPTLGADMVAFGGHKGLQAPWGIGGLYLSDQAKMECPSATCELPSSANGNSAKSPRPGYCDVGSVDQFALAGLNAAIEMLRKQDLKSNLEQARGQILRIRDMLRRFDNVQIYGAQDPGHAMPTLAFSVSGISSGDFAAQLKKRSVIVGSGFQCAPLAHQMLETQHSGLVRISVGIGQTDEEIEEAIGRIEDTLAR